MNEAIDPLDSDERCVIVVAGELPPGRAANAAAVIALSIGKMRPGLVGIDLLDASDQSHPGLIPIGISVLAAPSADLSALRAKALTRDVLVVDFPVQGQHTNDYGAFLQGVREVATENLVYVGVGIVGPRKAVGKVVGKYRLFS